MSWTRFVDGFSGGTTRLEWGVVYIEAPERQACSLFESLFGEDPRGVACWHCGDNYTISEAPTLEEATEFDRVRPLWQRSLDEYVADDGVLILSSAALAERLSGETTT